MNYYGIGVGSGKYYMKIKNKIILLIFTLTTLLNMGHTEEINMDTTSLESYLQSRGDMRNFDIPKYFKLYGKGKTIDLDDGSIVDIFILSNEVQEFHYLPQSSYNNLYRYDENGNLEFIVNYYGDIELHRTTYDTSGNLLTEEKGAVWDAPFTLAQVKALMKKVYDVDLDTLTSQDNKEYPRGEMHFNYARYYQKYVYIFQIAPEKNAKPGVIHRTIFIDSETGEVLKIRETKLQYMNPGEIPKIGDFDIRKFKGDVSY